MIQAKERFTLLAERWFIIEPAFFAIYCTHELVSNPRIQCIIRAGRGRLEYYPNRIELLSDEAFEECVRIELIRIMLKHPYERRPSGVQRHNMYTASDMVLSSYYTFNVFDLKKPSLYKLPVKKHYEWYLLNIPPRVLGGNSDPFDYNGNNNQEQSEVSFGTSKHSATNEDGNDKASQAIGQDASSGDSNGQESSYAEAAGLWEEDESRKIEVDETIEKIEQWGSIPGDMVEEIVASTKAKVDYRKILTGFRMSVLSNRRTLKRMRPNRRSGFDQMGSKYDFVTRLLVAVDVSGSITSKMLTHFYSVILKFFKYGIESVDVVQFDTEITGEVETLKLARKKQHFKVKGRGGTSFQPVFNYIKKHPEYDGLIILTDGYAPEPSFNRNLKTRVLWVCTDESCYKQHKEWMLQSGRCCYINLKQ